MVVWCACLYVWVDVWMCGCVRASVHVSVCVCAFSFFLFLYNQGAVFAAATGFGNEPLLTSSFTSGIAFRIFAYERMPHGCMSLGGRGAPFVYARVRVWFVSVHMGGCVCAGVLACVGVGMWVPTCVGACVRACGWVWRVRVGGCALVSVLFFLSLLRVRHTCMHAHMRAHTQTTHTHTHTKPTPDTHTPSQLPCSVEQNLPISGQDFSGFGKSSFPAG